MPAARLAKSLLLLTALVAVVPAQGRKKARAEQVADDRVTARDRAIKAIDKFIKRKVRKKQKDWKTALPAPPKLEFSAGHDYFWIVETDLGELKIRLLPDAAPRHVASTIYLARAGFYDGLTFPRVLKRFMAQGGSPHNTTGGNAGYTLDHEFHDDARHDAPGTLSAANAGMPNTDGSQFFLTFVATPHLDGMHTVYGRVVEGLETLEKIEACGVEVARDGEKLAREPKIVRSSIKVEKREVEGEGEEKGKDKDEGKDKGKGERG